MVIDTMFFGCRQPSENQLNLPNEAEKKSDISGRVNCLNVISLTRKDWFSSNAWRHWIVGLVMGWMVRSWSFLLDDFDREKSTIRLCNVWRRALNHSKLLFMFTVSIRYSINSRKNLRKLYFPFLNVFCFQIYQTEYYALSYW